MLFSNWFKYIDRDTAIDIWATRLSSVDKTINLLQSKSSQDVWALKYWQDVRRVLTRQLDNICQVRLDEKY